jgi:cyclopropane-fatty-acyl-phospholipid synthase
MDFVITILWILILVVVALIIYNTAKIFIPKPAVLFLLSSFEKGNFVLIDSNYNQLVSVINEPDKPIPIIKINNQNNFFKSIFEKSELGLGESYMRGEWESDDLVGFLNTMCLNQNNKYIPKPSNNIINHSLDFDKSNIKHHYDVGNDFYLQFLRDDLNAYSCGFWFNPDDTLNTAQYNKVNTIIKKLNAQPGSNILDIGCGWGKIANYVSKITKSKVTGVTISDEQEKYANTTYDSDKVIVINMDYRNITGQFDCIYSIGMFEHVRYENYDTFFKIIKQVLKPGGRFVLHTIITYDNTDTVSNYGTNFLTTHIFPGGQIPHNDWILNKARDNGLNISHFEGYGGQHYAKTLKTWREYMWKEKDYISSKYPKELMLKYDYYFAVCEAAFNTGMFGIGHYVIVSEPVLSLTNSFNYSLN